MANANGWGDGASNNNIGWGKGADNAIGWGSVYSVSEAGATDIIGTPAVDPDAQAFITAAAITDPTQQSAINTLVTDLKGYSIWTKFKAIYPIVGGSASSHAVNLKTPGTFNLTFATGWTHSSTGMTPLNAFANSSLIPNTTLTLNSAHISYYSRTNTAEGVYDMGVTSNGSNDYLVLNARNPSNNFRVLVNDGSIGDFANSDSRGLFVANRTGASVKNSFVNGVKKLNDTTTATARSTNAIYLGAINNAGSAALYSTKQCAFASIGDGLTDTDAANFYTLVNTYQTALSRNV